MSKRKKNPDQLPMGFLLPETNWEVPRSLPDLTGERIVAVDIETKDDGLANDIGPGWVYGLGWIAGVGISTSRGSWYYPIRHPETSNWDQGPVRDFLRELFLSDRQVVFHRAIYDLGWLTTSWDLPLPRNIEDTMIMEFTLHEYEKTFNLDDTCKRNGIKGKDEHLLRAAAEAYGCDPKKDMWRMPAKYVGPYGEQDGVATLEAAKLLYPQIVNQGCEAAYRLEMDLVPMVLDMRRTGIPVNSTYAEELKHQFIVDRNNILGEISRRLAVGREVTIGDINSPQFLMRAFESEGIPVPRTAKGNPSFESDVISKIDHWLPDLVVQSKQMNEASNKFIGNYIQGYTHRGRIHAEIHQTKSDDGGTRTTRIAYSDPPLQQMPSRNPRIKRRIRQIFQPEKGTIWGALDYSQQEYRLIVHFAYLMNLPGAAEAVAKYRNDPRTDFHTLVAEMTKLPRKKAKDVNFAKAFGAGVAKFALMTGMTLEEAAAVMDQYDGEMPFVKMLGEACSRIANQRGYIRLLDGARSRYELWEPRYQDGEFLAAVKIEEAQSRIHDEHHPWYKKRLKRAMTHKAMNSLIQGSAARMTKLAMRASYQAGLVPMLQMHDELDYSFNDPRDAQRAYEIMRDTVKLEVPVVVDMEFGDTWGSAEADKENNWGATWDEAWEKVHGTRYTGHTISSN